ncbi:HAD family hydrolase [Myceligenerans halotolerans]
MTSTKTIATATATATTDGPSAEACAIADDAATDAQMMLALDLDGTLVREGTIDVPPVTADAAQDVVAAGHHIVLSTGRSLVGALPVAASLGLTSGWLVTSNGAVIARLVPNAPGGYEIVDAFTFDVGPVVKLARELMAEVEIAVEEVGYGYLVTREFERGALSGRQTVVTDDALPIATTRLVLRAPGVVETLLRPVRALNVTATPASSSWVDVTPPLLSKATALFRVRRRLGVDPANTLAIGDALNDVPAFKWAATAIAMGGSPDAVQAAADATTGTLAQHGAATILEAIAAGRPAIAEPVRRST